MTVPDRAPGVTHPTSRPCVPPLPPSATRCRSPGSLAYPLPQPWVPGRILVRLPPRRGECVNLGCTSRLVWSWSTGTQSPSRASAHWTPSLPDTTAAPSPQARRRAQSPDGERTGPPKSPARVCTWSFSLPSASRPASQSAGGRPFPAPRRRWPRTRVTGQESQEVPSTPASRAGVPLAGAGWRGGGWVWRSLGGGAWGGGALGPGRAGERGGAGWMESARVRGLDETAPLLPGRVRGGERQPRRLGQQVHRALHLVRTPRTVSPEPRGPAGEVSGSPRSLEGPWGRMGPAPRGARRRPSGAATPTPPAPTAASASSRGAARSAAGPGPPPPATGPAGGTPTTGPARAGRCEAGSRRGVDAPPPPGSGAPQQRVGGGLGPGPEGGERGGGEPLPQGSGAVRLRLGPFARRPPSREGRRPGSVLGEGSDLPGPAGWGRRGRVGRRGRRGTGTRGRTRCRRARRPPTTTGPSRATRTRRASPRPPSSPSVTATSPRASPSASTTTGHRPRLRRATGRPQVPSTLAHRAGGERTGQSPPSTGPPRVPQPGRVEVVVPAHPVQAGGADTVPGRVVAQAEQQHLPPQALEPLLDGLDDALLEEDEVLPLPRRAWDARPGGVVVVPVAPGPVSPTPASCGPACLPVPRGRTPPSTSGRRAGGGVTSSTMAAPSPRPPGSSRP